MVLAVAFGASAKFRWGPVVGANFPYYYWEQNLVESTTLAGFSAGVQCELMIPGIGFGVDFGLRYVNRGGIGTTDLRLQTVQIPVNLRFKWTRMNGVENYIAPFIYGGPEFNFNVASTKCDAVKRAGASVGLGVGLGAELFKRYQLSGGYVWDVTYDVKTHKLDDFSARLEGWVVNFAVMF